MKDMLVVFVIWRGGGSKLTSFYNKRYLLTQFIRELLERELSSCSVIVLVNSFQKRGARKRKDFSKRVPFRSGSRNRCRCLVL